MNYATLESIFKVSGIPKSSFHTSATLPLYTLRANTGLAIARRSVVIVPSVYYRPARNDKTVIRYSMGGLPPHLCASVTHFSSWGSGGRPPGGNRLAQGVGLLGAAGVLLGKGKYLLGALKLTKLASLGSMVLSIGTYSMFFGFPYAVGIVGLTLVHEAGHAAVMLYRGIPFSPMVFMPFMGAMIAMNRMPRDAWEDALVAFGGPVVGSLGAGAVAIGGHMTDSQLLYALADFGFMVNLFNLLPIGSMDGGRIAGALSPYAGVAGLGMGGLLVYNGAIHNPIFFLVLLAGGYDTFMRFYNPHQHVPPNYYRITPTQRTILTGGYFGLVAALVVAMDANTRYRKPPEVLIREREMEQSWDFR
jgi:Zn-dependent protease